MSSTLEEYTVEIQLPPHKRGDIWPGVHSIGPVLVNEATPAGTLARVRMQFRYRSGELVYSLDSDASASPDAPISIDDATTWEASIASPDSFIDIAGSFDWDMEFYTTGIVPPMTYYKGVLPVTADTTN